MTISQTLAIRATFIDGPAREHRCFSVSGTFSHAIFINGLEKRRCPTVR
jgi:hypothetical protein